MFIDDDARGKALVVGVNVERALFTIKTILLDKIHVIHSHNLQEKHTNINTHFMS